jgi:hypothetical protein
MPTAIKSTAAPAIGGTKALFLIDAIPTGAPGGAALSGGDTFVADLVNATNPGGLGTLMGSVTTADSALKTISDAKIAVAAGAATGNQQKHAKQSVNEYILEQAMHSTVKVSLVGAGAGAVPTRDATGTKLTYKEAFDELFSTMYRPTSVKDFVERLSEANRLAIAEGIADSSGAAISDKSANSVYNELKKLEHLEKFLNGFRPVSVAYTVPQLQINQSNLSLLLANPAVAKVVMAERKKKNDAAMARPVSMGLGAFGGVPPPISMSFVGGANSAFASIDSSNYTPIEMRGAGPMLAAMRGGMGGVVIGTTSSPTQWRPIDDNSFISASLRAAYAQLKANLKAQGAELAVDVDAEVNKNITDLENAEKAVRANRDKLNSMNNAIATGYKAASGSTVDVAEITAATQSYNAAMKNRQKLENKLFRVVIALGGKQVYP